MKHLLIALFLVGCNAAGHAPKLETVSARPAHVDRVLVERTFAEVGIRIGDAELPPDATVLVLAERGSPLLTLRSRAPETSAVGEVVTALIDVDGDADRVYRVVVEPTGGARLLSPPLHTVRGGSRLRVRFTRDRIGKGGIQFHVCEIE